MQHNGPLPPLSTPYGAHYPPPPPPNTYDQPHPQYPVQPQQSYIPNGHPQSYAPGPSTYVPTHQQHYGGHSQPYGYQPSPHSGFPPAPPTPSQFQAGPLPPTQQAYAQPHYAPLPPPIRPAVEAVPPPTPKVDYAPPVFQTFQERKRAKELAIRAQTGAASTPPYGSPSVRVNTASAPTPPPRGYSGSSSPSPMSPPPAATVAMMGQPSPLGGPPPPPPARSRSPSVHSISPVLRTDTSSPATLVYPPSSSRPLPPPRGHSPAPPIPPPRVVSPLPAPISTGSTPNHSGPPSPFTPSRKNSLVKTPVTTPTIFPPAVAVAIQANLERSDTISSIKSLDRGMGFSGSPGKRPLPKPPVGVNTSKSLDRGIPSSIVPGGGMGEGFRKGMSRKQPSVVDEMGEEALVNGMAGIDLAERGTSPNTPSHSGSTSPAPSIVLSEETDTRATAQFNPLPAINVPDFDFSLIDGEVGTTPKAKTKSTGGGGGGGGGGGPSSPGIQFSGLPVISVSSSDTADEDSTGEISFTVPSINIGEPSVSQTKINVAIPTPSIALPGPAPPARAGAESSRPTRAEHTGSAIVCSGCDNPIIGRIVNAMNQRWHPQCFMCAQCGELLEHVSSYEWEGKAYCHLDYHDKFAHRCHHCKTPIVDSRFVTLNDPVLGQRYYHELHFFCSECGDPFLDPSQSSAPGTEQSHPHQHQTEPKPSSGSGFTNEGEGEETDEGETNAFVIHKGHPYCEKCHLRLHKPKCKGCHLPIPDMAINAMGAKWHKECFVCVQCQNEFANNLFFPKDGKAFCTSCYEDLIASDK
ncbi:hypothetical protein CI109_101228 [Kwoniella shandongensis]|uniref:Uncharacterized protein n=1 Tax=Kwoniella shandongensis TaxID=1734106 RepID=A0A5M6BXL1_9TREE|nr:uncharacterized protein CI109_005453 [Kwoniella shandongensis]KAA5526175.1 hypothetical protein CI109_005453 [Kwoniella shandongensis]